jgi:hypothetical protein
MASPLSVSQLLDSGRQYFDFVIFDEASQVLPEDAVPSILRGRKLVVAGDSKQLPPTTFFAASDDDESAADEESSGTEGFESLLDATNAFLPSSYLDWHYRSRDESLINFSNWHIYENRLVTFPGPGGPPALSHVLVKQEFGVDGQEESSSAEVQAVVSLVLEHSKRTPEITLGVITMGIRHMMRVQAALDHELENGRALLASARLTLLTIHRRGARQPPRRSTTAGSRKLSGRIAKYRFRFVRSIQRGTSQIHRLGD